MSQNWHRCRFCGKPAFDADGRIVKYGARHWAHHICYLDAGKGLSGLAKWQVREFPYFLLKKRGLLDEPSALQDSNDVRAR